MQWLFGFDSYVLIILFVYKKRCISSVPYAKFFLIRSISFIFEHQIPSKEGILNLDQGGIQDGKWPFHQHASIKSYHINWNFYPSMSTTYHLYSIWLPALKQKRYHKDTIGWSSSTEIEWSHPNQRSSHPIFGSRILLERVIQVTTEVRTITALIFNKFQTLQNHFFELFCMCIRFENKQSLFICIMHNSAI